MNQDIVRSNFVENRKKLKANTSPYFVATIVIIVIFIVASILKANFGEEIKNTTLGIFWAVVTIAQYLFWLKTRNPGYFIFSIIASGMSFSYISDYKGIYFTIPFILLICLLLYFIGSRQLKWRYRDVLEKAAIPVNEAEDGFTSRPMPAGKVNFTKDKFFKLGSYLSKNLIAFPIEYRGHFFYLVKNPAGIWFQNPDTKRDSYISFDLQGNISVNIAKQDYQKFKQELTFDKLNISLAAMFSEFWELFEEGKEKEIVKVLDAQI